MIKNPNEIENKSFKIIQEELNEKNISIDNEILPTILRVIHTSADFDYAKITKFYNNAINSGINSIKTGCRIYADTNMIYAGVNKKKLKEFNCEIYTLVRDDEVEQIAKQRNVTRSIVGMEKAIADNKTNIFVIGNAPTALFTLKKCIDENKVNPDLVIAVPVGFVGAEESKEEIIKTNVPCIVTHGRKGGSTIAVAIINSILLKI
jgi:precorrin-8X/cobalt-precorrin-8 methylmutase